jgi:hypothetical protein
MALTDVFALLEGMDDPGRLGGLDSLALFEVKDGVVAQQNRLAIFRFSSFLVLLSVFVDLPEDNLGAVFSFPDASAQRLGLAIGQPIPRAITLKSEKENIDAPVFLLAGKVCRHLGTPGLAPRRYTGFQLLDDGFSNDFVWSRH